MTTTSSRVEWVDYAKGICILLIVMLHSALGVEEAVGETGWLHPVVDFAKPFRMPDFFLIAGLFLSRAIDRDWRHYLDKKVVHYVYFYVLWLIISFLFKAVPMAAETSWSEVGQLFLLSFIEPFSTLWFIYVLPIMFVVAKLTRRLPWWTVWLAAAALHTAQIATGWTVIDEFASRFVFFFTGYVFAPQVFRLAEWAIERRAFAAFALAVWAVVNGTLVFTGIAPLPGVTLALGLAGAGAVVIVAALMSQLRVTKAIRYCGANSIVIYLAFFIPMAATREVLVRLDIIPDVGLMSAIVWIVASAGPLVLFWLVRNTPGRYLFERPRWATIHDRPSRLAPAE